MSWVFLGIAVGAAGFLVSIFIEYLKKSSTRQPRAAFAKAEIKECEKRIEVEQAGTEETRENVSGLKKEIEELEKELGELTKEVANYREREKRRNPTKFKLEE